MTFSPKFVFIKESSSGGSDGVDGTEGILGAGPKKFCLEVVCCGGSGGSFNLLCILISIIFGAFLSV